MLIEVLKDKLPIGEVMVYHRGDIFECRDPEALYLNTSGMTRKAAPGAVATCDPPKPNKLNFGGRAAVMAKVPPEAAAKIEPEAHEDEAGEEQETNDSQTGMSRKERKRQNKLKMHRALPETHTGL